MTEVLKPEIVRHRARPNNNNETPWRFALDDSVIWPRTGMVGRVSALIGGKVVVRFSDDSSGVFDPDEIEHYHRPVNLALALYLALMAWTVLYVGWHVARWIG